MTYPGGKNGSGVYQRIINHMPPHDVYIEGFCGSGAVLRNKKPAARNIAIDKSQDALDLCIGLYQGSTLDTTFFDGDTLELLPQLRTLLGDQPLIEDPKTLIYLDPPYVLSTRKGGELYDHEMSDLDHIKLLTLVCERPSMVMISGYRSAIYDEFLSDFHRIDYQTMTRQGMVDESLWLNFEPPNRLHDYSHLGENYRERERIKRKKNRFQAKFEQMPRLERLAIMEVLTNQK